MTFVKGSMAFPTGVREGSGLLVEKVVPAEVLAGQQFEVVYRVINLTDYPIENVVLTDRVSSNFDPSESNPKATEVKDGVGTWQLGELGGKETRVIRVKGSSQEEGTITSCAWASYNPQLCAGVRVVKANIQLTKREPKDVAICEPIPVTLTVKNTGSSTLTGVKVIDTLPTGLTSDGKNGVVFDAGQLATGESKEFKFNATAAATGKYVNKAKATSDQGVTAEVSAATAVHQAVLSLSCKAREQQYMNRPFEVCFTVDNKGDAPAAGVQLVLPIPSGLTFSSATAGGYVSGSSVFWDLGSVDVNGSVKPCATFASSSSGTYNFNASAKGTCAAQVTSACETKVIGIAAILLEKDDTPDPVAIGETTTYTIKVTNQGSADDNNVLMVLTIAPELVPVSATFVGLRATGTATIDGQTVTFPAVPTLPPKAVVSGKIVAKGVKAGDGHTKFTLSSDVLKSPIIAEESTTVY